MSIQTDLLAEVVEELGKRQGDLPKVARESGIPYDTVLRIKNKQNDPGYSKVLALHQYLFGKPDTGAWDGVNRRSPSTN
jgi:hypothetical protein